MAIIDLQNTISAYLKTTTADLIVGGVDLTLLALNNARRTAERQHDFAYAQANVPISITSSGTDIGRIKRIQNVSLPISGGTVPIEFMTNDAFNARVRMQTGRTIYNPSLTPRMIGLYSDNPICVQQGTTLYLEPASQFTFPIIATLSVVQWMPDYIGPTDTDFFIDFSPEYLQWQGILECNKLIKFFVERREGNLMESDLIVEATAAYNALIEWDNSIRDGTSTPAPRQP